MNLYSVANYYSGVESHLSSTPHGVRIGRWRQAPRPAVRIGALGDVLLTRRLTYSLSLSGHRSTLLAPARHASLLLSDPWMDTVLDSESPRFADAFAGTWPEEGDAYDVAVVLSKSAGLENAARAAAATVISFSPEPERHDTPVARQWAERVASIGPPFMGDMPLLITSAAEAVISNAVLIHPGSGSKSKNWPLAGFIELSRALTAFGYRVVWIRGPAEADFKVPAASDTVLDSPELQVLAATLARSALFIGNDSGVSHLAAAVGAPTLALFGPTSARVWAPDGPHVETLSSASGSLDATSVAEALAAAVRVARLGRPDASR